MRAPRVGIAIVAMAIVAGLIGVVGIAHVNQRQQIIHLGYELSSATDELTRQREENRRLRLEKAALTNPERVRRLAESLGMTQPGPSQIRVINLEVWQESGQAGERAGDQLAAAEGEP